MICKPFSILTKQRPVKSGMSNLNPRAGRKIIFDVCITVSGPELKKFEDFFLLKHPLIPIYWSKLISF